VVFTTLRERAVLKTLEPCRIPSASEDMETELNENYRELQSLLDEAGKTKPPDRGASVVEEAGRNLETTTEDRVYEWETRRQNTPVEKDANFSLLQGRRLPRR
jgi:hypothetical protein